MTLLPELQENISLRPFNTFGLEARARYFAVIESPQAAAAALQAGWAEKYGPLMILGGGSNVLFTRDWPGIIWLNRIQGFTAQTINEHEAIITAGSGMMWHPFVLRTLELGYKGLENLSLIPGTVGAAPMQNIGAYGAEIKQYFEQLEGLDLRSGQIQTMRAQECAFGYRESVFKHAYSGRFFITSVSFRLSKLTPCNISYGDIRRTLTEMGVEEGTCTALEVSRAVCAIRSSKLPDPAELGNAGSFFKNPEISAGLFAELQQRFPEMPGYPQADGNVKVPAGWLIERAGWKGKRMGNTGSHARQALVLVNYGGAAGSEIWQLAQDIRQDVLQKFGIHIHPEVNKV